MKQTGKVKRALLKTLDFLFPSLMSFIWSIYFLVYCHKNGFAIFGAGPAAMQQDQHGAAAFLEIMRANSVGVHVARG